MVKARRTIGEQSTNAPLWPLKCNCAY